MKYRIKTPGSLIEKFIEAAAVKINEAGDAVFYKKHDCFHHDVILAIPRGEWQRIIKDGVVLENE